MEYASSAIETLLSQLARENVEHRVLRAAVTATYFGTIELKRCFQTELIVQSKGIANYVTEADLAAEKAVVDNIRSEFATHAIISEESHNDLASSRDLWIVDPLDGTSNFMHRIPHFAVSIAYYQNGQPQIGIVCNPITDDWYVAVAGMGAWHNGKRQRVSESARLDESMIACGFYYDRGAMMESTLSTIGDFFRQNVHGVRRFGAAALDLCNVGCGQYGVFFEFKLHPWDFAAGQLFVKEAGGRVTSCDNKPLPLHCSSSICATNGVLHSEALEVISQNWAPSRNL